MSLQPIFHLPLYVYFVHFSFYLVIFFHLLSFLIIQLPCSGICWSLSYPWFLQHSWPTRTHYRECCEVFNICSQLQTEVCCTYPLNKLMRVIIFFCVASLHSRGSPGRMNQKERKWATATATKTSLKKWIRSASNLVALCPSRSIRQMLSNVFGVEF